MYIIVYASGFVTFHVCDNEFYITLDALRDFFLQAGVGVAPPFAFALMMHALSFCFVSLQTSLVRLSWIICTPNWLRWLMLTKESAWAPFRSHSLRVPGLVTP